MTDFKNIIAINNMKALLRDGSKEIARYEMVSYCGLPMVTFDKISALCPTLLIARENGGSCTVSGFLSGKQIDAEQISGICGVWIVNNLDGTCEIVLEMTDSSTVVFPNSDTKDDQLMIFAQADNRSQLYFYDNICTEKAFILTTKNPNNTLYFKSIFVFFLEMYKDTIQISGKIAEEIQHDSQPEQ